MASSIGKAKSYLLTIVNERGTEIFGIDEATYLNIPAIRYKEIDTVLFEGRESSRKKVMNLIEERYRIAELDAILSNQEISHCYIYKNGSYYADNSCGYVSREIDAGIYTKQDAVIKAKSCNDLRIYPIDIEKHNQRIHNKINDLKLFIVARNK